nr:MULTISPECIES: hypothetical protein [unclassified Mesorhizobium]
MALIGTGVGEIVQLGHRQLEIVSIS